MRSVMIAPDTWIEHLVAHLPAARDGTQGEGVHQVRVAAGRLRVWLALGGRAILRDDLRWLRSALGPVRDLDVLLGKHASAAWARELEGERAARRAELARALDDPRLAGLITALRTLKPVPAARARKELARMRRRVLRAGDELARDERDPAALHRLRRKLRHLRYAHEWIGEKEPDLVELQDALGELNNLAVALIHLDRVAARAGHAPELAPGFADERAAIESAFDAQRAVALAAWRKTESKLAAAA